jgi:hypothetical protein
MHKCILLLVLRFLCWTHDRLLPLFVAFFTMESGWNPKIRVTRGRCYDHNFLRFSPMFLKTNVMIQFLPKLAVFRTKNTIFFTKCCCENIFKSWQMSLTGRNFTTGKNQLKLPTYVKSSTIFKTGFIVYITFLKYGSVLGELGEHFRSHCPKMWLISYAGKKKFTVSRLSEGSWQWGLCSDPGWPGTDVLIIFAIFWWQNWRFWLKAKVNYSKFWS